MMSEETIIVEVEPESIKPLPVDVKVTSIVLGEEIPDNINISKHSEIVVEGTIISVKDEEGEQKNVKESLLWDEKRVSSNEPDGRPVRRSSTSMLFGPNKGNVPSRYRGSSVGSCHDFCKFGHKNTSEVKSNHLVKRSPLLRTVSGEKDLTKSACSAEKRNKSVIRRLSFPAAKTENQSQMHMREVKQSGKGMVGPKEKPTLVVSPTKRSVEVKKLKDKSIPCQKPLKSSSRKVRDVEVIKGEEKPLGLVSETVPLKPPMKKVVSMTRRIPRDPSRLSHLKNHQSNCQQEAKAQLPEDMPEKILYMTEPNGKSTPAETSQEDLLDSKRLLRTQGGSHAGTRKSSKASENGSDDSQLTKSLLPYPDKPSKSQKEKLEETESVVKLSDTFFSNSKSKSSIPKKKPCTPKSKPEAPKAKPSKAKQNGSPNSHLTMSLLPAIDKASKSSEEELGETESIRSKHSDTMPRDNKSKPSSPKAKPSTPKSKSAAPKAKQNVEPKAKVTRAGKGQNGEEGSSSIWKMKFRRGKVVALPTANNSPKKLKFKRPRGLSDNQHAEINPSKVNYKNKEVEGEEPQKDGDEPAKVVLRRQEATCKKDDVDLNNVIEETASKLVKTRKSKVKALVGAFETVMSLRDRKASEATVAS